MARRQNISAQTRATLTALKRQPFEWHYGYDLMRQTGLASGTLYPMLMRLCDHGMLEAQWVPSPHDGRPPRHAYRLTAAGIEFARSVPQPDELRAGQLRGIAS
jgi:PadR family transcriptional regulator, regulatory protein PadR